MDVKTITLAYQIVIHSLLLRSCPDQSTQTGKSCCQADHCQDRGSMPQSSSQYVLPYFIARLFLISSSENCHKQRHRHTGSNQEQPHSRAGVISGLWKFFRCGFCCIFCYSRFWYGLCCLCLHARTADS